MMRFIAALAVLFGPVVGWVQNSKQSSEAIIKHIVLFKEAGAYCAWPSIVRAGNGDLLVAFTKTEEHLAPDGMIMLIRSIDNGETWSTPQSIFDTVIDDRESGFTLLNDGAIIGHFWSTHWASEMYASYPGSYEDVVLERWSTYVDQSNYVNAKTRHGAWNAISTDHGKTWSEAIKGQDSIHGGVQLDNGTILVASYRLNQERVGVYAAKSFESGWEKISEVVCPLSDSLRFGEPHILQLPSGRVIMMIRATTKPYNDSDARCVLWQSHSDDDGKSWAPATPTVLWGFPPHLTLLSDGRALCTYGYRRAPFGQRACVSNDGVTWNSENEVVLRDDAPNKDLGYPVSIELEPGKVLSVYYQPNVPKGTTQRMHPPDPKRTKPAILGTIWKVRGIH